MCLWSDTLTPDQFSLRGSMDQMSGNNQKQNIWSKVHRKEDEEDEEVQVQPVVWSRKLQV